MEELQNIQDYIHVIRGHRVMLDRDIATFYGSADFPGWQVQANQE